MMNTRRKIVGVLATISTSILVVGMASPALADTNSVPQTTESSIEEEMPPNPVIADYEGKKINLAEGWGDAQVCTEFPGGEARCYRTEAEAAADLPSPGPASRAAMANPGNCATNYWCLFDGANYTGMKLQFFDNGKKNLADWGFRDRTSSIFKQSTMSNFGLARLIDLRSWPLYDRQRDIGHTGNWQARYPNLSSLPYPGGGDWYNKTDIFQVNP